MDKESDSYVTIWMIFSSESDQIQLYRLLEMSYEDGSLSMLIILPESLKDLKDIEKISKDRDYNKILKELYKIPE